MPRRQARYLPSRPSDTTMVQKKRRSFLCAVARIPCQGISRMRRMRTYLMASPFDDAA